HQCAGPAKRHTILLVLVVVLVIVLLGSSIAITRTATRTNPQGAAQWSFLSSFAFRPPSAVLLRRTGHSFVIRHSSFVISLFLLSGCRSPSGSQSLQRFEFSSPHMGTLFKITFYAPDKATAQTAAEAAFHRVAALDDIMSDYQADSELMRLCAQPAGRPAPVSAELFDVLQQAQRTAQL